MKRLLFIYLILIGFSLQIPAQEHRRYALIWSEEFDSGTLDEKVWSKIPRRRSDWAIHMSPHDSLYAFEDGDLVLRGMVNDFLPKDTAAFLTGGIWTKNKKAFGFGKIEIRAKFDVAQGFWPAIWMQPQSHQDVQWPHGGEIDIMEHFRSNPYVNQTIHSNYTYHLRKHNRPRQTAYPAYKEGQYNTYGVERFQDSLVFFVNGKRTFNYPRFREGRDGQFPFSNYNYYLILDAQLGRDNSPYIDTDKLPVTLRVDYVRYYELDTKTDIIPEPKEFQVLRKRKFKLKKVNIDSETIFENPDEYHLIIKRGKVTIAGNAEWAKSTLAQLTDENGKVPEVEIHDWAACPYRGIAIQPKGRQVSVEELTELFDLMAFYKLNCLQWDAKGASSKEEANIVKELASAHGITMVTNPGDLDFFEYAETQSIPLSSQIFLHTAASQGGLLSLSQNELTEAVMALSERYWRGGDAGELEKGNGFPKALSPAGSRLANFKERAALQKERFHHK
jgi:hypothetical protein